VSWSRRFERPIATGKGKPLVTLRDAMGWLAKIPKDQHKRPDIQLAAQLVTHAAEQGGIVLMAEIAVRHVVNRGKAPPSSGPLRRKAKKYRLVR